MAECGGTIQYAGGPKFTCTLTVGHKGPHGNAEAPVSWTSGIGTARETTEENDG